MLGKFLSSCSQRCRAHHSFNLWVRIINLILDSRPDHRQVGPFGNDLKPYHVGQEPQLQNVAIDGFCLLDIILVVDFDELLLVALQPRNP